MRSWLKPKLQIAMLVGMFILCGWPLFLMNRVGLEWAWAFDKYQNFINWVWDDFWWTVD